MRHRARLLAGKANLGATAALLHDAALVVCNNTGISHLAQAVGVPSVVLIHDPVQIPRWGPLNVERHRPVCWVGQSAIDTVLKHAHELLAGRPMARYADAHVEAIASGPMLLGR
jgi:ADP-heptose:LPS heptosyltransferase